MKHALSIGRIILVVFFALLPLVLPGMLPAAEPENGKKSFLEPKGSSLNQIAVESVQDTLKACLSRIPLDASAGQLKLAEQNCQQVAVERQEVHLTF